jgi:hypothetical protein
VKPVTDRRAESLRWWLQPNTFQGALSMNCPNGHRDFIIGPEYNSTRTEAIMTCLHCGARFDAYAAVGVGAVRRAKAA